jgi:flagellar protein FliJ
MSKPFSLQPLLEIMQTRTDEATRRLAQLISAEQNARSRLQLLIGYRDEYATRFRDAQAGGLSQSAWHNYQEFIARIETAIEQQQAQVRDSEQNAAQGKEHWQEENKKLKAIDTLKLRHLQREVRAENRNEQKLLDEFSTRQHFDKQRNE